MKAALCALALIGSLVSNANACGMRDNGSTYLDAENGIELRKCPVGSRSSGNGCAPSPQPDVFEAVEAVSKYGAGEWRLLTRDEALLVAPKTKGCEYYWGGYAWTSSELPDKAFGKRVFAVIHFASGSVSGATESNMQNVYLARVTKQASGAPDTSTQRSPSVGSPQRNPNSNPNSSSAPGVRSGDSGSRPADQQLALLSAGRSRELQAKGDTDAQRKGRRSHDPAAEAHECIQPNFSGLYGGMRNLCGYKVWYAFCALRPSDDSWLTGMDCEKQQFGTDEVGPQRESASHTKGAAMLHWFACKDPAWPLDLSFEGGQIRGRCRDVGK